MSALQVIAVVMPVRIISEANARDHWASHSARVKRHRTTARTMLARHPKPPASGKVAITLTREGPRKLDDDNLAGGFKALRDGIADWMGIDDGSDRLSWRYEQRTGRRGEYAAHVLVQWVIGAEQGTQ